MTNEDEILKRTAERLDEQNNRTQEFALGTDGYRLYRAAPELLAALEDIVDIIECYCDDHNSDRPTDVTVALPRLKEAIAKAKGAQ